MRLMDHQRRSLGLRPPERTRWRTRLAASLAHVPVPEEPPIERAGAVVSCLSSASPASGLVAGAVTTITVALHNEGPAVAGNVLLALPLPPALAYRPATLHIDGRDDDASAPALFGAGLALGDLAGGQRKTILFKAGVRSVVEPVQLVPVVKAERAAILGARPLVLERAVLAPGAFTQAVVAEAAVAGPASGGELPFYELDDEETIAAEALDAALSPLVPPGQRPKAPLAERGVAPLAEPRIPTVVEPIFIQVPPPVASLAKETTIEPAPAPDAVEAGQTLVVEPPAEAPATQPVAMEPVIAAAVVVEPVVVEPVVVDPVVAEPVAEPVVAEPVAEAVVAEPVEAAVIERVAQAPVMEPVTEPAAAEPVTEPAAAEPVAETVVVEPSAQAPVLEPVAEPAAAVPVAEAAMVEPIAEAAVAEAVVVEPVEAAVEPEAKPRRRRTRKAEAPSPAEASPKPAPKPRRRRSPKPAPAAEPVAEPAPVEPPAAAAPKPAAAAPEQEPATAPAVELPEPQPVVEAVVDVAVLVEEPVAERPPAEPALAARLQISKLRTLGQFFAPERSFGMTAHYLLLSVLACRDNGGADRILADFFGAQEALLTRALIARKMGKTVTLDDVSAPLPAFPLATLERAPEPAPRADDLVLYRTFKAGELDFLGTAVGNAGTPAFVRAAQLAVGLAPQRPATELAIGARACEALLTGYASAASAEINRLFVRARLDRKTNLFGTVSRELDERAQALLATFTA